MKKDEIMGIKEFSSKFKGLNIDIMFYCLYKILCKITSPEEVHDLLNETIKEIKDIEEMEMVTNKLIESNSEIEIKPTLQDTINSINSLNRRRANK